MPFNNEFRRALAMAREEAIRLQHNYVGTEHLLLGLTRDPQCVGAAVLIRLSVDLERLRQHLEGSVPRGTHTYLPVEGRSSMMAKVDGTPYTPSAKSVIASTMAEAREMGHTEIGTGHLLLGLLRKKRRGIARILGQLGLLRERQGVAAQALGHFGVSLEHARHETQRLLNDMP